MPVALVLVGLALWLLGSYDDITSPFFIGGSLLITLGVIAWCIETWKK